MTEKEKYIGVFDSGIGGLTVVKSIVETMPNENIIYFGDTAHVPYGTRSKEQITEYVLSDVKFLSRFNIKAIVIACNTADSAARDTVEKNYSDIPVYGVVADEQYNFFKPQEDNALYHINAIYKDWYIDSIVDFLVPLMEYTQQQKGEIPLFISFYFMYYKGGFLWLI